MDNKYKIGVGINYWDDPKGLIRILESSLYDCCYVVYVIDGKYKNRKDNEVNDITLGEQICKHYDKCHYVKMKNSLQIEKRNRYWELAEKDNLDFLIICDSDHIVDVSYNELKKDLDIIINYDKCQGFPIRFENGIRIITKFIGLYKKPFDFRHKQNTGPNISHGQLFKNYGKGNEDIIGQYQKWMDDYGRNLRGIYMVHDKTFRSKKRIDWDYQYYLDNPTR